MNEKLFQMCIISKENKFMNWIFQISNNIQNFIIVLTFFLYKLVFKILNSFILYLKRFNIHVLYFNEIINTFII